MRHDSYSVCIPYLMGVKVSIEEEMLRASCALEDAVYNLVRPVKTLRIEVNNDWRRWQPRTPAMAAGLTDHAWTIEELMMTVVVPEAINT